MTWKDGDWLVKRRRYDGSTSVITARSSRSLAQATADAMNDAYQSTQYYIEQFDEEKSEWPT